MSLKILYLARGKETAERGFIVGASGRGKSVLAAELLPASGKLAIIDPKRLFKTDLPVFSNWSEVLRKKPQRFCYRPHEDEIDNMEAYNQVYRYCYMSEDFFIYTDEVAGVMDRRRYPEYLKKCYQLGRGKGITMLSGTQRPMDIPMFLMTEATKIYAFFLSMKNDIDRVKDVCPDYEPSCFRTNPNNTDPRKDLRYGFYFFDNTKMDTSSRKKLTLI